MESGSQKELFSSLVSDIKNYNGEDPLSPWWKGVRKMQESLPPHVLSDKLPRFLQKCAETFESDRRYRNDSRYLRIWIQLMDYVDDAKAVLRKMEKNQIGLKRSMFYSAYALYYERRKKYEDAEKMYYTGAQNLAQPAGELQRSYEQFLHRMNLVKKRKANEVVANKLNSTTKAPLPTHQGEASQISAKDSFQHRGGNAGLNTGGKQGLFCSDETVVVKFVGSAITERSEAAEDACHHGLVDPTINTKEAMNAIGNMFREPLDPEQTVKRRSNRRKPEANQKSSGFEVYVDEHSEEGTNPCYQYQRIDGPKKSDSPKKQQLELQKPFIGGFKVLADDEDESCIDGSRQLTRSMNPPPVNSKLNRNSVSSGLREDTVIRRFIGSTGLGESEVENACHHGLVDPTINMKEAMHDINTMFGEPLNFVRLRKQKKQSKSKQASFVISILADDDDDEDGVSKTTAGCKSDGGGGLFEPTLFTKEAMDDINEMFGKPLDF